MDKNEILSLTRGIRSLTPLDLGLDCAALPNFDIASAVNYLWLKLRQNGYESIAEAFKDQVMDEWTSLSNEKVWKTIAEFFHISPDGYFYQPGVLFSFKSEEHGISPKFTIIPAGLFEMGQAELERAKPTKNVLVGAFAMAITPTSFQDYKCFRGDVFKNNWKWWGANKQKGMKGNTPALHVNRQGAVEYARWLGNRFATSFRLPLESEWEWAARGGTQTRFWWGDRFDLTKANAIDPANKTESKKAVTEIGTYPPNPFGLVDMIGNCQEWCEGPWSNSLEVWSSSPDGPTVKDCSALRGGSWQHQVQSLGSGARFKASNATADHKTGMRIATTFDSLIMRDDIIV